MPSEANRLPMPKPIAALDEIFDTVDERVRSRNFYDAVAMVDQLIMPVWMSAADRASAEAMLVKLVSRRKSRNHSKGRR